MRPAARPVVLTAVLVLLSGMPGLPAADKDVAPERRTGWERERQRAQSVAELLVRQEWARRQGPAAVTATATSMARTDGHPAPALSAPGSDAGLDELFLDDEPRSADTIESAPLLPATSPDWAPPPTPATVAPATIPVAAVPPPAPVVPILSPPTAPGVGGVELFHLGYSRFSQGDWAGAREAFASFMAAHPVHDLTDNAAFWLAECTAQEGRTDAALAQFQQVAQSYPHGDKTPDAQVRIAVLQGEAGRRDEARRLLQGVVRDWPGTAAARRATELLAAAPPAAR